MRATSTSAAMPSEAAAAAPSASTRPRRRAPLLRYAGCRVLQGIPLILGVMCLNFVLIKLAPGDPIDYLAPEGSPESYRQEIREEFGLDRPAYVQLFTYLGKVLTGDLGFSLRFREDVLPLVFRRLGPTALLGVTGFVLGTSLAIALAIATARRPNSWFDRLVSTFAVAGYSVPIFWTAQGLLLVFGLRLGWLPTQGMQSVREDYHGLANVVDILRHLTLPAIAFSIFPLAVTYRVLRAKLAEESSMDYAATARAKGAGENRVIVRHLLPNAMLPVITVSAYNLSFMLAGSVLIETVFAWPGLGRLLTDALYARDYQLILGMFIVTATIVVALNIIADVLYTYIDPRVSLGRGRD